MKLLSKSFPFVALFAVLLLFSGCLEVKTLTLYDGVEKTPAPPKPEKIRSVVEPIIYADNTQDVWGLEETECIQASVTDEVVATGDQALKVSWNRYLPSCDWIGFGVGWDNWIGKDLSEVIDYVAIEMSVRSQEGKMFGLPIVLTLEDYSGVMSFSYTQNKYFERTFIDEEWQKVRVPLNSFNDEGKGIDMTNIKQLQLELQQSGKVYIDDIKLVFYEEPEVEPWLVEAPLPNPTNFPIMIFGDQFINDNDWGIIKDDCQEINLSSTDVYEGQKAIEADWKNDPENCYLVAFGASWHKWNPVDVSSVMERGAIEFMIKNKGEAASNLPIRVGLEDYDRVMLETTLTSEFIKKDAYGFEWQKVTIPFTALKGNGNPQNIKHMVFWLDETGNVLIDQIRLVFLENN